MIFRGLRTGSIILGLLNLNIINHNILLDCFGGWEEGGTILYVSPWPPVPLSVSEGRGQVLGPCNVVSHLLGEINHWMKSFSDREYGIIIPLDWIG